MSLDNFLRWVLFSAGIILAIFAGYMFYIDKISAGAAWLALSIGFLCFATRLKADKDSDSESESESESDSSSVNNDLHDMALLIADLAVSSLKNIGRTVPPAAKEIGELEGRLNKFLDSMPLDKNEREEIADEFDKLRNRTRRNEGGRALIRNSRL